MYSHTKKYKKTRTRRRLFNFVSLILVSLMMLGIYRVALAFPSVYGVVKIDNLEFKDTPRLPWPNYGQSAAGVQGYGIISESPNQTAKPIASVTKLVTALAVLEKHPLKLGEQGEEITFNSADVEVYNEFLAKQGVVVDIKPGQSISHYQAMQYMLILSANNIAYKSAEWAFGSIDEYKLYANKMVKRYGLDSMNIDDASGFSPKTVSTAGDLVKLGDIALQNPVIAEIVAQDYAKLPDGKQRINTNPFLNYEGNGVIGIKNGLTDEAGGVLLAAAKREVDGSPVTIITVVMGSEFYFTSQKDAVALIEPALGALGQAAIIESGKIVGYYELPWGGQVPVITKTDIELNKWSNAINSTYLDLYPVTSTKSKGDVVGTINVSTDDGSTEQSKVILADDITSPSVQWRIKNPTK